MVSFQTPTSPNGRIKTTIPEQLLDNNSLSSKKRKWLAEPRSKGIFEIELHLQSPLPLDWQRCLDIQSGEIYFYNTRTNKKTCKDPRRTPEPPQSPAHVSLELELNLPCRSTKEDDHANDRGNSGGCVLGLGDLFKESSRDGSKKKDSGGQCPSWLAFDGDEQEMVAAVCTRCHMLVMLCKSSPACPNCKFMHPPDVSPSKLFKQGLSLLC